MFSYGLFVIVPFCLAFGGLQLYIIAEKTVAASKSDEKGQLRQNQELKFLITISRKVYMIHGHVKST